MGGHPPESEDSRPIDVPHSDADEGHDARVPLDAPSDSVEEQPDQSFPVSDPPSWSRASILSSLSTVFVYGAVA
jgi:hypothetical protein